MTHRPLQGSPRQQDSRSWWTVTSAAMTCLIPSCALNMMGIKGKAIQQAWREKVALCMIILTLCVFTGFLTFGIRTILCPPDNTNSMSRFNQSVTTYPRPLMYFPAHSVFLSDDWRGSDITSLFAPRIDACIYYTSMPYNCTITSLRDPRVTISPTSCPPATLLNQLPAKYRLYFEWNDIKYGDADPHQLLVFNGVVINATEYYSNQRGRFFENSPLAKSKLESSTGRDATKSFYRTQGLLQAVTCLQQQFIVGYVDKDTIGCFTSSILVIASIGIIGLVITIRFIMAFIFHWFTSHALTQPRRRKGPLFTSRFTSAKAYPVQRNDSMEESINKAVEDNDFYVFLFVTCYSESYDGIRGTLDSLAGTDYDDTKKLLMVVCDGIIQGEGNDKSTPDIVLSMLERDPNMSVDHMSYIAIADGDRQHNMAQAHGGYYVYNGHRVPMMVVIKTGTPKERLGRKPGNRGKRDSQLLLMNFLSRALLDDRMTPLDYDMFWKIQQLVGVSPDRFEGILMVDADTVVNHDSLSKLVNAMQNDVDIVGLCGETRIANKRQSWVTMIQVFEYYISHHLGKGFESVFGGVTCLPGCFCMYRIKAPKGEFGHFVPLLVNPDIVDEYSENVTDTLHKKNLLLLGEDRFLTTLILRNFPKRKMVFLPQAICHTTVPDTFRVLLSQRRRWINSTIHNLMELILVKDLCGIFCFSMQFVIALELLASVLLPAAVLILLTLIILAIAFGQTDPLTLGMLAAMFGLPGVLILITTRKVIYLMYMLVYLLAMPIWNMVLPVYAFVNFDNFSWGETRKVEGGDSGHGHDHSEGKGDGFDSSQIVLKKWAEWEGTRAGNISPITP
ncbi:chitin synthase [Synchytrium endobioticum]|uniref:chitin synthase n=1 Tax=Synchytrium endobioticum TaxID=286115 RepID=A0A507DR69_9FUNG|nr:chitin synthase [Synchytrium endobioticum]